MSFTVERSAPAPARVGRFHVLTTFLYGGAGDSGNRVQSWSPALWCGSRAVVATINATIVERSVDLDPVGVVDASLVPACRAYRIGTRDLDPALLFARDGTNLVGHLDEVLVLAEDHRDVEGAAVRTADD